MFLRRCLNNRGSLSTRKTTRAKQRLLDAIASVMCERLEPRQLLTAYFYTVPANWASAYLVSETAGEVEVRRDGRNIS